MTKAKIKYTPANVFVVTSCTYDDGQVIEQVCASKPTAQKWIKDHPQKKGLYWMEWPVTP